MKGQLECSDCQLTDAQVLMLGPTLMTALIGDMPLWSVNVRHTPTKPFGKQEIIHKIFTELHVTTHRRLFSRPTIVFNSLTDGAEWRWWCKELGAEVVRVRLLDT